MGSLFLVTLNTGIVFGFILTNYLRPLFIVPIICACLLILYYSILLTYLFDTPRYLLEVGLVDEAKRSLQFYWNSKDQKDVELDEHFANLRQNIATCENEDQPVTWKILCKILLVNYIIQIK